MTLDTKPAIANNIIKFDGTPGRAAMLNYSVPLPGRVTGRRAVLLDLGLAAGDWTNAAKNAGTNVSAVLKLTEGGSGVYTFDASRAIQLWMDHAMMSGVPGDDIQAVSRFRSQLEEAYAPFAPAAPRAAAKTTRRSAAKKSASVVEPPRGGDLVGLTPDPMGPPDGLPGGVREIMDYLNGLTQGKIVLPKGKVGGGVTTTPVPPPPAANAPATTPQLMIMEVYCISSFLSDYGLGRTVKTFTLLPGEQTTISLKTWRSTEETQEQASSIIDSYSQTAADKFRGAMQTETSSRTVTDVTSAGGPGAPSPTNPPFSLDSFAIDIMGYFKIDIGGQYGTETHSSRDDFSKIAMDVVHEHANEASAKRENTVTSSSESIRKSGEETATERTIKNVNLRRVLNFVFRELNQEYVTKIHLKEIRIAFTNGRPFSYREVPLSGLRKLLREVVVGGQVDAVAQRILKNISVVFDVDDDPVPVLEAVTMNANGQSWNAAPAAMVGNNFPAPTDAMFYRFKRGALGQDPNDPNPVEGVVLEQDRVTLRTDSVIVEALLGQADALDQYAMEMQAAEAAARTLANEREKAAQDALEDITGGTDRSQAFAAMFNVPSSTLRVELVKGEEA